MLALRLQALAPLARHHAPRRCLCATAPPPPTVVAARSGLLMLESDLTELPTGRIVRVGAEERAACVLFRQHGHYFATLLGEGDGDALAGQACELSAESLTLPLPELGGLAGRAVDCFGAALDGGAALEAVRHAPIFADQPSGSARGLIVDNLHTGWLAIDALTPIGRGQSMLLVGARGMGKTTLATGAVRALAEPRAPPTRVIYAELGGSDGADALRALGLAEPVTFVRRRSGAAALAPHVEEYIMAATAVAIGESYRDRGEEALVVLDELSSFRALWHAAAQMAAAHDGSLRYANGAHEITELRPYYSALLQRSAKLAVGGDSYSTERGGRSGSLSLLTLVEADTEAVGQPQDEEVTAVGEGGGYPLGAFTEAEFGAQAVARLAKLAEYRVPITDDVLAKMDLKLPAALKVKWDRFWSGCFWGLVCDMVALAGC